MGKPNTRGNGQGSAIKRGNTWQARVVIGWKENKDNTKMLPVIKTKGGFKTKKEALEFCAVLKLQQEKPKEAPTLEHYWKIYEKELYKISEDKQTAYRIAWKRMDSIKLRRINTLTVSDLRNLVESKTKTYYTAKDMKTVFRHLFDLAGADQFADKSLPDYIVLPKLEETERIPFTEEEQKKLWKSYESGNKDASIPLIMIYTGMMTGEMKRLSTEMIDIIGRKITGIGMKTKVRRNAEIYLAASIIPVLEELTKNRIGRLFPFGDTKFYRIYYDALKKAGVRPLSPYSCRHTTATALAIDKNIAPQTIKKVMRWSTTKMLDRYAHPKEEDITAAVDAIGK